ncbi:MAG: hypothetical protein QXS62_06725 [Sulfolobales archaeon]
MSTSVRQRSSFEEVVEFSVERPTVYVKRGSGATVLVNLLGAGVKVILSSSSDPGLHTDIRPSAGVVPLTALVTVHASPTAELGVRSVRISALDRERRVVLASASLQVIVVDDKLLDIVKKVGEYRLLYREKGTQYTLLKVLWDWRNTVFTFAEIKAIYEMLVARSLSKGTVHEVLKRMLSKGLVIRRPEGYTFNPKITIHEALRAIDVKRSLNGKRGAMSSQQREATNTVNADSPKIPHEVRELMERASQLAKQDYWKAVDLIAHTLVGVRETGIWFLWVNDLFIYREEKTGFFHYFKSRRLSEFLKELGFGEGLMFNHTKHSAKDLIHDLYWSYPNARRLHYLLKQQGWFEYPNNILLIEFYHDSGKIAYIAVRDLNNDTVLWGYGSSGHSEEVERFPVIPGEHVDRENEETYFYRPAGIF